MESNDDSFDEIGCSDELSDIIYKIQFKRNPPKNRFATYLYCLMDCFYCCCCIPCPPCPCCMVPKFAFQPPKQTYDFEPTEATRNGNKIYRLKIKEGFEKLLKIEAMDKETLEQIMAVQCYYIYPKHTKRLACYYMKSLGIFEPVFVVLFCHPNATDLSLGLASAAYLSLRLKCDIFEFDYCGYGASSGRACESNIMKDVTAAYDFLVSNLNVNPNRIIVYGKSIGTVAAIRLAASGVHLRGLVLEGILMSAFRFLCPDMRRNLQCDQFQSSNIVHLIKCPTLIIQGGLDETTYYEHAEHFFELCKSLVPPLIIPKGSHNNLTSYRAFWNRLEIFFGEELGGGYMPFHTLCGPHCLTNIHMDFQENDDTVAKHIQLRWPFRIKNANFDYEFALKSKSGE